MGLKEIGFADHFPLLHLRDESLSMGLEEVPIYVEEIYELKGRFPEIDIKLGIEADYVPEVLEELNSLLERYPFDYVFGSIHYVDGWGFDDPRYLGGYEKWKIIDLYRRYFQILGDAAETGMFDILAHPDLVKKFGYRPEEDLEDIYLTCLERVARAGIAVEINTSGLRKPAGEIYPALPFMRICRELGIGITLGSDAHEPADVGRDFQLAVSLMEETGYEDIILFEKRNPRPQPLKLS